MDIEVHPEVDQGQLHSDQHETAGKQESPAGAFVGAGLQRKPGRGAGKEYEGRRAKMGVVDIKVEKMAYFSA
jgi:hypothetical protein